MNANTNLALYCAQEKTPCPTLEEYFETYIADRRDLREGTIHSYRNAFKRAEELKGKRLDEIKYSDIKHHYAYLRYDRGYSPASISLLHAILIPVFNCAVRDDYITKNPAQGVYHELARGPVWKSEHRPALTPHETKQFLDFIRCNPRFKRWEPMFVTLFGTGLRVGELIALKWEDVSFKDKTIFVSRAIVYNSKNEPIVGPPKTAASVRMIPLLSDVSDALVMQNQLAKLTQVKNGDNVPGKKGYIFLTKQGRVFVPASINSAIDYIVKAYNKEHLNDPLPHFSVHQIRHSFCSRLCEMDVNVKVIQSVMGHSDYQTTMDIYTDITNEKKQRDFSEIDEKMKKVVGN